MTAAAPRLLASAIAVLAAVALAAGVAAAGAPAARIGTPYVDGISEQNVPYWNGDFWHGGPAASPFGRFLAGTLVGGGASPLRFARYVVAYDVMCDTAGPAFATFESWLADVEALGLKPVVAFWYGDFDGNRCSSLPKIPATVAQYNGTPGGGAVAAFLTRFPQVTTIEPWNEPNLGRGPDVAAATAASFWLAVARTDCAARTCAAVVGGDFSDATRNLVAYEQAYVTALGGVDPVDWGIHPYAAVNHRDPRTLSEFEAGLPDRATDRVWYTEVGAFYCTPHRSLHRGYTDAKLQAMQEEAAHYLTTTLMQYPFVAVHVFYYELMYKDNVPGPCATDDSALYGPTDPGALLQYAPRAAVQDIFPFAAPPQRFAAPGHGVFYGAVDWQPWLDGWRTTSLSG